jgi:hypothetical protein
MIVFDTAPTGHTLKLLELPTILQVGLDKLESWQATLWGYWEMIRGTGSAGVKEKVATKLKEYKASIGRVSDMITDSERTRFVVVCIAEYLSISESRRLLSELDRFKVVASHIVVNQLVTTYLEEPELASLAKLAGSRDGDEGDILYKALAASRLTSARRNIQSKYLKELQNCPEVKRLPDPQDPKRTNRQAGSDALTVLEVPLLPSEVTGPKAILGFSHYLIGKELESKTAKSLGVEGSRSKKARAEEAEVESTAVGVESSKTPKKKTAKSDGPDLKKAADGILAEVMKDPELAKMIEESPKLKEVVKEVKDNPMAGLKYMSDPEVQPFLQKAMGKIMPGMGGMDGLLGGMGGAGGNRKGKGEKKSAEPFAGLKDLQASLGGLKGALGDMQNDFKKEKKSEL